MATSLVAPALAAPARAATGVITTAAGSGVAGFAGDGGLAASAELSFPRGLGIFPGGGFLIADRANNRVRRVWRDGTISTVAGNGTRGFSGDGGPATDARVEAIHGAVPTSDGGFLIADMLNYRVRKVTPGADGVVDGDPDDVITTVVGSGSSSSGGFTGDGGAATSARISAPRGIAVTPDGNLLIADTDNQRVRRVTPGASGVIDGSPDEIITTVAGSGPTGPTGSYGGDGGPATDARLDRPFGVAPTADGGFLIADNGNRLIRRVAPDGIITTVAGRPQQSGFSGDGGAATDAELDGPHGVASTPDGGFLIADKNNQRVRHVAPGADGVVDRGPGEIITTVAGSGPTGDENGGYAGDGGPAVDALLDRPKGIAVTGKRGFLIADESNHRVRFVRILSVDLVKRRLRVRRGGRVRVRYTSTMRGRARLDIRRRGRRVEHLRRRARAGRNRIRLRRRHTRRLQRGRHRLVLTVRRADGQRDRDRAVLKVRRRRR